MCCERILSNSKSIGYIGNCARLPVKGGEVGLELTPQFGITTDRRSSSSGLLDPSVNLTKLPHKNQSHLESSLPVLDAFFEREETSYQQYKIKNEISHAEGELSPMVFFEKNHKRNESTDRQKYKATAKEHPERQGNWQSNYLRGLYPDKSNLNRSPIYYNLLAKSMQSSFSVYPIHNYHQGTQLHHHVIKQGERATSYNLDLEENRSRKTIRYRTSETFINGSNSSSAIHRRPSSLLYHFNILREDYNKELCSIECRKEKNEREFYCNSEFGGKYILMGLIYHRRYILPTWAQERVSGRLKPGDGLVKSSSYVRRYNKKRDQRVQLAHDGKCGSAFFRSQQN
ncbi:uncharacterized protein LOC122561934 isoform X3 [Chiloscyllium plagiosum]|uniref:uncharacterized protein LOC122561934 isoform X3 n=1 Tax=Chiloscyllium plagiosum TaxID=36176 RepID=UPI001CB8899A|nr:uncharacterized protein LOC122561934 isoform X3 [Chiloscyllium plagiosum]